MKSIWAKIALALIILGVLIQFVPVKQANPTVTRDLDAPADVKAVLKTACYNCHSNETTWPWYSHIAPGSWLITGDVNKGRLLMNFSRWDTYNQDQKAFYNLQVYQMVSTKQMPPLQYLLLHPEAKLNTAQIETLKKWKPSPNP